MAIKNFKIISRWYQYSLKFIFSRKYGKINSFGPKFQQQECFQLNTITQKTRQKLQKFPCRQNIQSFPHSSLFFFQFHLRLSYFQSLTLYWRSTYAWRYAGFFFSGGGTRNMRVIYKNFISFFAMVIWKAALLQGFGGGSPQRTEEFWKFCNFFQWNILILLKNCKIVNYRGAPVFRYGGTL